MGTRSLTIVQDEEGDEILTIYRQFDGYPDGIGNDLKKICPTKITNGFSGDDQEAGDVANGMGCLAATLVKELKDKIGNVYVYAPGSRHCGEEYVYVLQCVEEPKTSASGKRRPLVHMQGLGKDGRVKLTVHKGVWDPPSGGGTKPRADMVLADDPGPREVHAGESPRSVKKKTHSRRSSPLLYPGPVLWKGLIEEFDAAKAAEASEKLYLREERARRAAERRAEAPPG